MIMYDSQLCLNDILPGQKARVLGISPCGSIRRRFLDRGLVKDTQVECLGQSPWGDPKAYLIRGAVIALRSGDSRHIQIAAERADEDGQSESGEGGADGCRQRRIALAGNPNVGKSTLFNGLTGGRQHTGKLV